MLLANAWPWLLAVSGAQLVRWIVWSGLVAVTLALLLLMRTRWGHSNPLRKCIVLSLLAHLLLGIYATTVSIVSAGGRGGWGPVRVALIDGPDDENSGADGVGEVPSGLFPPVGPDGSPTPDPAHPADALAAPVPDAAADVSPPEAVSPAEPSATDSREPEPPAPSDSPPLATDPPGLPSPAPADDVPAPEPAAVPAPGDSPADSPADANIASLPADDSQLDSHEGAAPPGGPRVRSVDEVLGPRKDPPSRGSAGSTSHGDGRAAGLNPRLPGVYQRRVAGDRLKIAQAGGGSADTESAVAAALAWLVGSQSADGRWNVRKLEGGREVLVDGQDRGGAGARADAGITGLALLALLASGHTPASGDHAANVERGLGYLIGNQSIDGCLAGDASFYEKMYSHAMATCALGEAFGMTADRRLEEPLRKAVGYTLAMQHPQTGGWRYQRHDPGDTSQLGWQLMSIKSAELAGLQIPAAAGEGAARFLRSVALGRAGGLACYRPGHRPSRPMTAEALACRQFLGQPLDPRSTDEAAAYLLAELPGQGPDNFYYWYYGTLAMFQVQGEPWRRWNAAMQATLLRTQRHDGSHAGSWDPDGVWGAYGGRAYSTALGALCLEVYYRYLPLYVEAAGRTRRAN